MSNHGISLDDLENRFSYHPPKDDAAKEKHEHVRTAFLDIAVEIVALIPAGREASTMVTKLEEAMYWANAAIARD